MAMERERYIYVLMHYDAFVSVCMFTSLFFEHTYIGGGFDGAAQIRQTRRVDVGEL